MPAGASCTAAPSAGRWAELGPNNGTPAGRWGHSVTWLAPPPSRRPSAVAFGGELLRVRPSVPSERTDSLLLYTASEARWREADGMGGVAPEPRRFHAAAAVSPSLMLVTGGMGSSGGTLGDAWLGRVGDDGTLAWAEWRVQSASTLQHGATLSRWGHTLVALPPDAVDAVGVGGGAMATRGEHVTRVAFDLATDLLTDVSTEVVIEFPQ